MAPRGLTVDDVDTTPPIQGTQPQIWSGNNLPTSMGMLDPPQSWHNLKATGINDPNTGRQMVHSNGLAIMDLGSQVPRHFPAEPDAWQIEWYRRQHPDMSYKDLNARMPAGEPIWSFNDRNKRNNKLNRVRQETHMRCWTRHADKKVSNTIYDAAKHWTWVGVKHNTTWVL